MSSNENNNLINSLVPEVQIEKERVRKEELSLLTLKQKRKRKVDCEDINFTLDDLINDKKNSDSKRKIKKKDEVFQIPLKVCYKSASLLCEVIEKIKKIDPLQILLTAKSNKIIPKDKKTAADNKSVCLAFTSNCLSLVISKAVLKLEHENNNNNIILNNNEITIDGSGPQLDITEEQVKSEIPLWDKFQNVAITDHDLVNINVLKYKVTSEYYQSMKDFHNDIITLFFNISLNNKLNQEENLYLSNLFIEFEKNLWSNQKAFEKHYHDDITKIMENNNLPKCPDDNDYKSIPVKKNYETIDSYVHIEGSTPSKIKTSLEAPFCEGNCCDTFEKLGPHSLEKESWKSDCPCRTRNLECNSEFCKCDRLTCKNQAINNNIHKKLEVDVVEKYSWGIDLYTFRNLIELLPNNFTEEFKASFIEKVLLKSLRSLGKVGYDFHLACEKIRKNDNPDEKYSETHIFLASHLYRILDSIPSVKKRIKAFSKGVGMFCNNKEGIKENEFITGYYGEIYPPWYWYEKQDLIKSRKLDKELPDFYNIMLERLKCDKRGYDVIVVDPNSKGNFASRMSHSCASNCNTVLMAANKEYLIGMYATKAIEYGEELTFNYNSFTEKKKEYLDAICLCGSYYCRGHYLIFAESMVQTDVLSRHHNFLHRNYILYKACGQERFKLTDDEDRLLNKYAIRNSILANTPNWLKKWAAMILEFIEYESEHYPEILLEEEMKAERKKGGAGKKSEENDDEIDDNALNNNNDASSDNSMFPKYRENKRRKYNDEDQRILDFVLNDNSKNNIKMNKRNSKKNEKISMIKQSENGQENKIETTDAIDIDMVNKDFDFNAESKIKNDKKIDNIQIIINNDILVSNESISDQQKEKCINSKSLEDAFDEYLKKNQKYSEIDIPEETKESKEKIINGANCLLNNENDIKKREEKLTFYRHQARGITDNRIQNLAITINKVMHVLSLLKTESPPLIALSKEEIFEYLYDGDDSIRGVLLKNFKKLLEDKQFKTTGQKLTENIQKIINLLKTGNTSNTSLQKNLEKGIEYIKSNFLQISTILRECEKLDTSKRYVCYSALSDMIYLNANTTSYFTHNPKYNSVLAEEVCIRKRDINTNMNECYDNQFSKEKLDEPIYTGRKEYDKFYIWGQLIGWFKQTVDKPNASLSAERRGSLAYPDLECFFLSKNGISINYKETRTVKKEKNMSNIFNYPYGSRKTFFTKLLHSPSFMWPVGNDWSFKNKKKIYGTVQLESIIKCKEKHKGYDTEKIYLKEVISNLIKSE